MKYMVIRSTNGRGPFTRDEYPNTVEFLAGMRASGFIPNGNEESTCKLEWMRGLPKFKEFHGPTPGHADSESPIARYDDWDVSRMLSE